MATERVCSKLNQAEKWLFSQLTCGRILDILWAFLKGQVHRSLIKLLFSNLLLILSVNSPTHMYLSDLRVYFKVEVYFRVT